MFFPGIQNGTKRVIVHFTLIDGLYGDLTKNGFTAPWAGVFKVPVNNAEYEFVFCDVIRAFSVWTEPTYCEPMNNGVRVTQSALKDKAFSVSFAPGITTCIRKNASIKDPDGLIYLKWIIVLVTLSMMAHYTRKRRGLDSGDCGSCSSCGGCGGCGDAGGVAVTTTQRRYPEYEPFFLQWHVTDRCNLSCAHCYRGVPEKADLPWADLQRILHSYTSFLIQINRKGRLQISGGEPYLSPPVDLLIEAEGIHLPARILTNGTLIRNGLPPQLSRRVAASSR